MMNSEELMHELEQTLLAVETQMEVLLAEARKIGATEYYMMNRDGTFAMIPLLTAKASILSSLVSLQNPGR